MGAAKSRTIAELMLGPTGGFDWLRLWLALEVVAYHATALTYGHDHALRDMSGWYRVLADVAVPGFFAISGFLVAASADRNAPPVYAAFRALRLVPALGAVSLLTIFVVGPLVTTLPLAAYFADSRTWAQLTALVGLPQTVLPGFQGGVMLDFNGSLWSIPWEVGCYVGLGLLSSRGLIRDRAAMALAALIAMAWSVIEAAIVYRLAPYHRTEVDPSILITNFAMGAAVYAWRAEIFTSWALGLAALLAALALLWLKAPPVAAMPFLTYGLIGLGLAPAPKLKWDLSYGIYISAFPAQQLLSLSSWGAVWWVNGLVGGTAAAFYAAISWNLIEAPSLALRRRVALMLDRRARAVA